VNSTQLPSNTLVVNLQPPGQSFYLPSSVKPIARSESPSFGCSSTSGYSSDPESEIRKAKQVTEQQMSRSAIGFNSTEGPPQTRKRRQRGLVNGLDDEEEPKTATWQELFKCACRSAASRAVLMGGQLCLIAVFYRRYKGITPRNRQKS